MPLLADPASLTDRELTIALSRAIRSGDPEVDFYKYEAQRRGMGIRQDLFSLSDAHLILVYEKAVRMRRETAAEVYLYEIERRDISY